MRIAVCDDEQKHCEQVKRKIEAITHSMDVVVDIFQNGRDLLKRFLNCSYDVVFLDIEMPGTNGIQIAKKLRQMSGDVALVFLTGHVEYALAGYEVNALRYLTKPVREDKLKEVLHYVIGQQCRRHFLWLKTEDGMEKVAVSDIRYLEARNQNVIINTAEKIYEVRYNISDYENELREYGFFRIHRGYLVQMGKIIGFQKKEVVLEGDISLPVSRARQKPLQDAFYQYIQEEAF